MKTVDLSIVIPCYNHGEFIEESVLSIINNSGNYSIEIIIVNDGSTDQKTIDVLNQIHYENTTIINQKNQGLAKSRNNGISKATGKYILPLDSDNNVTKGYLQTALDVLFKYPAIDIVYGDALYIGERDGIWKNQDLDKRKMLIANQIDACAIFKKTVWEKVSGYSEDMPYMGCEDWNFWLKCMSNNFNFKYLNEICFEYRVLSNSMIRNVPPDFNQKILAYNCLNNYQLYFELLKKDQDIFHNIFSGNILKKTIKLILNHFGKYTY